MGKKSGIDSVAIWAEKLSIELNADQGAEVLRRVKLYSHDVKRQLTESEFKRIAADVKAGR